MDNTVKILIIVVIILVGALGLAGGFILQGQFMDKNSTVNQSNTTVNTTNNNTTQSSDQSNNQQSSFISASQAISIAQSAVPEDTRFFIITSPTPDYPYYQVGTDFSYGHPDGHVTIDAVTGEVVKITHGLSPP